MVRRTSRSNEGQRREAWTAEEDNLLAAYISKHGEGKWKNVPKQTGLRRCAKSCRLRWMNYLRPDIKRGNITEDEEDLILRLHKLLGNRWSLIAGRLPGRTDNEIKNYWNTYLAKREQEKQSNTKCLYGKKEIAEAEVSRVREEAPERVTLQPMASPNTHVASDTLNPNKPTISYNGDSDVATAEPVVIDGQSSPINYAQENADGSFMDLDFGDDAFLQFLDLDFIQLTDCEMFDMSNLKPEGSQSDSPPLSSSAETTPTQGNGKATNHSCETPSESGETIWSAGGCLQTDLFEECNIWN